MAGKCGTCTACCRVFAVPEIGKKNSTEWCQHCDVGKGCKIYENRPMTCQAFECIWLESQRKKGAEMPLELRPDKCKVVICGTTNARIISVITMPGSPGAWRRKDLYDIFVRFVKKGFGVVAGPPGSTRRTMLVTDPATGKVIEKESILSEPDEFGMQWSENHSEDIMLVPTKS